MNTKDYVDIDLDYLSVDDAIQALIDARSEAISRGAQGPMRLSIEIENDGEGDSIIQLLEFERPENENEKVMREMREKTLEIHREDADKREYERLKKKFETK